MPDRDETATFLPVEVRRHGPARDEIAQEAEAEFLSFVRIPSGEVGRLPPMLDPRLRLIVGGEAVNGLADMVRAAMGDTAYGERVVDVLEAVVREPGRHAVIVDASGSAGAVLRRGIECHFVGEGVPFTVRVVHEILSTWPERLDSRGSPLAALAAGCALNDVILTQEAVCEGILAVAPHVMVDGPYGYSLPKVRLETHVRGVAGIDPGIADMMARATQSYVEHQFRADDELGPGPVDVLGTYLSGHAFLADDAGPIGEDAAGFRRREVLRACSLVMGTELKGDGHGGPPEIRGDEENGCTAMRVEGPIPFMTATLHLPPGEDSPAAAFGEDGGDDPRGGLVYVSDPEEPDECILMRMVRTLTPSQVGDTTVVGLDIRVTGCLGLGFADEHVVDRAVGVLRDQAYEDATALLPGLAPMGAHLRIAFHVPERLAGAVELDIVDDGGLKALAHLFGVDGDHVRWRVAVVDPLPPVGVPSGRPALYEPLPAVAWIDPDTVMLGIEARMERQDFAEEMPDTVHVLRIDPETGEPEWRDLDECEGEPTREPFLLARVDVGGLPMPFLVSTVSGDTQSMRAAGMHWLRDDVVAAMRAADDADDEGGGEEVSAAEVACLSVMEFAGHAFERVEARACPLGVAHSRNSGRRGRLTTFGDAKAIGHVTMCSDWLVEGGSDLPGASFADAGPHDLALCVPCGPEGILGGRHPGMLVAKHLAAMAERVLGDGPGMAWTDALMHAVSVGYLDRVVPGGVRGADGRIAGAARIMPGVEDPVRFADLLYARIDAAVGDRRRVPLYVAASRVAMVAEELLADVPG